jgi:hypothetical protein
MCVSRNTGFAFLSRGIWPEISYAGREHPMRKYTTKFIERFSSGRLHTAACPFPGKYPLRMYYRAGKYEYSGKFHSAVWREFKQRAKDNSNSFRIYDKAGHIMHGTVERVQVPHDSLTVRYFGRSLIFSPSAFLGRVEPTTLGRYRMYLVPDTDNSEGILRFIDTRVAHVRTV